MLLNEIGIKITEEEPKNLSRNKDSRRYCDYVGEARENNSFYIVNEDISCPLARYNLGLEKYNQESIYNLAQTLVNWNDAKSREKAFNYLKSTNTLSYGKKYISIYPVNEISHKPDIVILFGTPDRFMPLVREITKLIGEWTNALMSGVGGMCAECTAIPLVTGKPNLSLGCGGSRPHGKLNEEQLLISLPYELYKTCL